MRTNTVSKSCAPRLSSGCCFGAMSFLRGARKALGKYVADVKKATTPSIFDYREQKVLWDFAEEETLDQWDCISDKDMHGHSMARLEHNGKGTGALFHGNLSTELPPNKAAIHSGYCAIRAKPMKPEWFQRDRFDVSEYDAFEFRVRSDGRRFIANVGAPDFVRKDDVWQCFFFPRGGPEWENITLNFHDFFVTHRGYMQDHPFSFPRKNLHTFGILLADRVEGEFKLEIKHIKAVRRLVIKSEFSN